MNSPWTYEELRSLSERLELDIQRTEEENPDIRPLPPLGEEEAKNLILNVSEADIQRLMNEQ